MLVLGHLSLAILPKITQNKLEIVSGIMQGYYSKGSKWVLINIASLGAKWSIPNSPGFSINVHFIFSPWILKLALPSFNE